MSEKTDAQLLREYAEDGNETAFHELVVRHADLVYSAALRQVESPALARDVAQGVFTDLARKARGLAKASKPETSILGWLHRSTRFAALNQLRADRRRQARERQAMEYAESPAPDGPDWDSIRPVLDETLSELSEEDREALLLRFFKNCNFRAIGDALGISDDAAQKRVCRALERLRASLIRRGVTATTLALSTTLSTNAVGIAPAGLAATFSAVALSGAATATATAAATTITQTLTMTALQKTWITVALIATIGTGVYQVYQVSILRDQVRKLQDQQAPLSQQIAQYQTANQGLSNQLAQAKQSLAAGTGRLRELLRLRGEVGVLRRQKRELEQMVAANSTRAASPASPTPAAEVPQRTPLAPLQMLLVADESGQDTTSLTNETSGESLRVNKTALLDHTAVQSATAAKNAVTGDPEIQVQFSPDGQELFAAITRENINKRLAIVVNGHLYSAPVIRSEIAGGKAVISGRFTEEEAQNLAQKVNEMIRNP